MSYGSDLQRFLAADLPDPPWIITQLMTSGNMLIAGRPKVGKSFFSNQLAYALANQEPVLRWEAPARCYRVLYVQLDSPLATFHKQLKDVVPGAMFGFAHFDHPEPAHKVARYFLSDERTRQHAKDVVDAYRPEIVFWDNLTRMDFTSDYNDRAAVSRLYHRLESVWQGPSVFLVHSNKERQDEARNPIERISGSQAFAGDSDCGVLIEGGKGKGIFSLWSRIDEDRVERYARGPNGAWVLPPQTAPLVLP